MMERINRFLCQVFGHDWYPEGLVEEKDLFDMKCYRCGERETVDVTGDLVIEGDVDFEPLEEKEGTIDRIEGDLLVILVPDGIEQYHYSSAKVDFDPSEGQRVLVTVVEDEVKSIRPRNSDL